MLPRAALDHPALKAVLEDPAVTKCVHNQAVDDHALHNEGVGLAGCVNTLGLSRWAWPELVAEGGFGLKNLMAVKLHRNPICEYEDVVNDVRTVTLTRARQRWVTKCSCGDPGCRLRKARECVECGGDGTLDTFGSDRPVTCRWCSGAGAILHDKTREQVTEEYTLEKQEKFQHPLESIVPGHPRWDLLVKYAAEDAVAALEVEDLARKEPPPAPFPYAERTPRPRFSQTVEDRIVEMERTGFGIDTEYCARQAVRAEEDERKTLRWLRRWFQANITQLIDSQLAYVDFSDAQVDAIWSSPKQVGQLFDALEFPRSPVWKKGRVKSDQIKLDAAALEWIAKEYPPSRQLIGKLLHLKRIRSGKKYLVKMRDCGGWVNPICGPAGDRDDRNGAVTGRLGIKGVLEAQQLPSREEADLYQIRKAVIA